MENTKVNKNTPRTEAKINKRKNQARGTVTHKAGKVLIMGDTHFSEVFVGSHKNYLAENIWLMKDILKKVGTDTTGLIFLGDVFGVREQRIKSLVYRSNLLTFFKRLKMQLERNNAKMGYGRDNALLSSVKGNHDHSGVDNITEFEFFIEQGMFDNPRYVDLENQEGLKTRLHFVNYGDEKKTLEIAEKGGVSNVILGHGEYIIKDKTNWFQYGANAVNIADMENYWGIDLIISGHIHTPSQQFDSTVMANNEVIKLFYPGSPSRVSERVEDVYYVEMMVNSIGDVEVEVKDFGLPPVAKVFLDKDELVGDLGVGVETSEDFNNRNRKLKEILDEIISSRISQGNLLEQVDKIPSVSEVARNRAKQYLQMVD